MKIYPNLESIAEPYPLIFLDALGVFWADDALGPLPGAADAMRRLITGGKQVWILSNATQLGAHEAAKIAKKGIVQGTHYHTYLTSGDVVRDFIQNKSLPFATPRLTYFLQGGSHPKYPSQVAIFDKSAFREVDSYEEADFVFISVPHLDGIDQEDPEKFRSQVAEIPLDKPVLCPNPDQYAYVGEPPRPAVRQGAIARLFEERGGHVHYIGKPGPFLFERALKSLGNLNALMVGDTPETDIRGARKMHIKTALVVQTGVMFDRVKARGVEAALESLPPWDRPDYFIERLG